jgi:hypothetical protein
MTLRPGGRFQSPIRARAGVVTLLLVAFAAQLEADQVETQTGDRYVGKVLSVNADTVVFQSEVLGTVKLPRAKISQIKLATNSPTQAGQLVVSSNPVPRSLRLSETNSNPELAAAVRQLGSSTNLIQQVQSQFLNSAGPEAKEKFDQLLGGYLSGKLSVEDIRAEAKTAADQLRSARNELGGESAPLLDSYLAILDKFLNETTPATTNTPLLKPGSR